jgi:hypothetical protein
MELVPAAGPLLCQILDESHGIWSDGLTPAAYARYNASQLRTSWGGRHLRRLALRDAEGQLLSSAKQYALRVTLNGRQHDAVGIGAVFTPAHQRCRGYGRAIIERIIDDARTGGAALALLFTEIGTDYYTRLGFAPVALSQTLLSVADARGAPMMLVRAGDDRDVPAVAALARSMAASHRFALVHDDDSIRFSLSKKRLLAGFSTPGALTVEFFVAEEGPGPAAFVILTTAGDDVVLEMCGDRDPSGARVGGMLQVLRARTPAAGPLTLRASLPPGWCPPQLRTLATARAADVLMVRPLRDGVLPAPLREEDVLFWHGDRF